MEFTYKEAKEMLRKSIEDKRDVVFAGKIFAMIGFIEKLEKMEKCIEDTKRRFGSWKASITEKSGAEDLKVVSTIGEILERQAKIYGLVESERKITIVIKSNDDLKLRDWVGWFHDINHLKCEEQDIDFKINVE